MNETSESRFFKGGCLLSAPVSDFSLFSTALLSLLYIYIYVRMYICVCVCLYVCDLFT